VWKRKCWEKQCSFGLAASLAPTQPTAGLARLLAVRVWSGDVARGHGRAFPSVPALDLGCEASQIGHLCSVDVLRYGGGAYRGLSGTVPTCLRSVRSGQGEDRNACVSESGYRPLRDCGKKEKRKAKKGHPRASSIGCRCIRGPRVPASWSSTFQRQTRVRGYAATGPGSTHITKSELHNDLCRSGTVSGGLALVIAPCHEDTSLAN
jgi:hypothetical protein